MHPDPLFSQASTATGYEGDSIVLNEELAGLLEGSPRVGVDDIEWEDSPEPEKAPRQGDKSSMSPDGPAHTRDRVYVDIPVKRGQTSLQQASPSPAGAGKTRGKRVLPLSPVMQTGETMQPQEEGSKRTRRSAPEPIVLSEPTPIRQMTMTASDGDVSEEDAGEEMDQDSDEADPRAQPGSPLRTPSPNAMQAKGTSKRVLPSSSPTDSTGHPSPRSRRETKRSRTMNAGKQPLSRPAVESSDDEDLVNKPMPRRLVLSSASVDYDPDPTDASPEQSGMTFANGTSYGPWLDSIRQGELLTQAEHLDASTRPGWMRSCLAFLLNERGGPAQRLDLSVALWQQQVLGWGAQFAPIDAELYQHPEHEVVQIDSFKAEVDDDVAGSNPDAPGSESEDP